MQAHCRDECALTLPSPCSKTVPQTATPNTFPPFPLPNHLRFPSRWRTLYTLLDSDGGANHTTNALPPKSPSLVPRYQSNLIAPKGVNHVQLTSA
jgi:hypothetical protein